MRLDHATLARVRGLPRGPQEDDRLPAEDAKLLAVLRPKSNEERGHAIVIVLAPFLEWMVMALGALHAHAQEDLRDGFRPFLRIAANAVEIGWAVGEGAAFRQHDLANKFIHWFIIAQLGPHPVVEAPHSFFFQG